MMIPTAPARSHGVGAVAVPAASAAGDIGKKVEIKGGTALCGVTLDLGRFDLYVCLERGGRGCCATRILRLGRGGKFAFGHEKAGPEHFQSRTLMKRFNVL